MWGTPLAFFVFNYHNIITPIRPHRQHRHLVSQRRVSPIIAIIVIIVIIVVTMTSEHQSHAIIMAIRACGSIQSQYYDSSYFHSRSAHERLPRSARPCTVASPRERT